MSTMGASTGKLMVGRGAAVLIGFAAAPVLTRVYDPADFGLAEIVSSVCVWAGSFACLCYAAALPLSKDSSETRSLIRLCLLLTLGLTALLVLGVAATGDMTARLTGKPVLRGLLWFVPAVFLLLSLLQVGQRTCSREGRFGVLSVSYFMQESIRPLVQIGLGWWVGATAGSLLWGAVAGHVCGIVVAGIAVLPVLASRDPAGFEASSVADVARRHDQFPKVLLWSTVVNTASRSLPILLIGGLFGTAAAGQYGLGQRVLGLPLMVLGFSIAQVFYPEAGREWAETGSVSESMHRCVRAVSTTCIFPVVTVALLGPFLFEFVFGARWREAGVYAQLLAPWMLVTVISAPLSSTFVVVKRSGVLLGHMVVLLAARVGAVCLGGWLGSGRAAMACLSGSGVVVLASLTVQAWRVGRVEHSIVPGLLRDTLYAVALALPAAIAFWVFGSSPACLGLLAVASVVHGVVAYRRSPMLQRVMQSLMFSRSAGKAEDGVSKGDASDRGGDA